ncbi:hypothetical protein [Pseudoxanthomonas sp. CF125]|uniref:hypothetical protein n=1 Tax=Pseudoxanthomonas sp. CF125 TaxID=1855303 RepID=UPI000891A6F5|nr:hypothetical protein [Pseudoxanthomonas sp. CF125]SDQ25891.1 hypothetical protein SAMN05216569_0334 [Pseudoxanthomonas sp. CF125]
MDNRREHLTFEQLDAKVDEYIKETNDAPPGHIERWSFALGLFSAGMASLIGTLVDGWTGVRIVRIGLILELAFFAISMAAFIRRNWKMFHASKRSYAKELDHDYGEYMRFLDWLRSYKEEDLSRKLMYIRDRKGSMTFRLGLLTGGVERLGVLPVLVALYFQFKDWEFGDWEALGQVNLAAGLLLWALLLLYLGGWWLIRLKLRLDTYEILLAEATRDEPASTTTRR